MIDGANYKKVLEVTSKAEHMGLIIVPPYFKETIIEPASRNEVFKVEVSELRYPTIRLDVVW